MKITTTRMVSFPIFNNLILGTSVSGFMAQFQNQVSASDNYLLLSMFNAFPTSVDIMRWKTL